MTSTIVYARTDEELLANQPVWIEHGQITRPPAMEPGIMPSPVGFVLSCVQREDGSYLSAISLYPGHDKHTVEAALQGPARPLEETDEADDEPSRWEMMA